MFDEVDHGVPSPEPQMRKSISSANPSRLAVTEWLLARVTTPDRAAAIFGDLTELAATRGRLWFWTAYTRTLVSLGWRSPVALVAGSVCTYWLGPIVWHSIRTLAHPLRHVLVAFRPMVFMFAILGNALLGLFFLVPFLMIRFGLRDRLTRLAGAIFVLTLPYFSLAPVVVLVIGPLMVLAVLAAMCLRNWRRPMIVLALALVPQYLVVAAWLSFPHGLLFFHLQGRIQMMAPRLMAFAVTAIVCVVLHRRLLQAPTSRDSALA
jgi:hypothetical protein